MAEDDFIELMLQLEQNAQQTGAEKKEDDGDEAQEDPMARSKQAQQQRMRGLMCSISLWVQLYDHRVRGGPLPFVRGGEDLEQGVENGFKKRKLAFHANPLP